MKESTMTEKEYNKRMSAYCRLLNNASVLSSERNGVRSATTRRVQMIDDLSRPDELKKGDTPAVVVYAYDRSFEFLLAPGESLVFDEETNTATFTSNETTYTISSAEGK
jgi:hypothetical protein